MSDWTKEPWRLPKYDEEFCGACVVDSDGYLIADCNIFGVGEGRSEAMCLANAKRVISSVNALAGRVPERLANLEACIDAARTGMAGFADIDAALAAFRGEKT